MRRWLMIMTFAGCATAQKYEFGAFGGAGFLGQATLPAATGITAGLQSGVSAGAFLGQNLYAALGGEVRYEYQQRGLRLASGGAETTLPARAHVLQYDLIWHAAPPRQKLRPYLTGGGGFKLYQGTGGETAWRPLMDFAYLTRTQQWSPMLAVGAGIKWRIGRATILRADVRDQVTRFPDQLIAPAPGVALPAWVHDVVPSVGVGWVF